MATLAELEAARVDRDRDRDMVLLIHQGKTARQIAELLGLTSRMVRHRARARGLKCQRVRPIEPSPTRIEYEARPCHHKKGECKSVPCLGHRFGANLLCQCGVDWHYHQRNGVPCETEQPAERLDREHPEVCCNGHDTSDPESVYTYPSGKKECRECGRERSRRSYHKLRTHCMTRNHEMTPENTYVTPQGRRECRECRGINNDRRKQRDADKRAAMEGR